MRRLRIACGVVALTALLWTVPVTAQPERSWPPGWGGFAEGVLDWAVDLWRAVAGSEAAPPPSEPVESGIPDAMSSDGSLDADATTTDPGCNNEAFPGYDPNG